MPDTYYFLQGRFRGTLKHRFQIKELLGFGVVCLREADVGSTTMCFLPLVGCGVMRLSPSIIGAFDSPLKSSGRL